MRIFLLPSKFAFSSFTPDPSGIYSSDHLNVFVAIGGKMGEWIKGCSVRIASLRGERRIRGFASLLVQHLGSARAVTQETPHHICEYRECRIVLNLVIIVI